MKTFLGRPWRPCASVAFINTEMSDAILPEGWDNWHNPENEKTARFTEGKKFRRGREVGNTRALGQTAHGGADGRADT